MSLEELLALRTIVARAAWAIRYQHRNKNTLEWTKMLRKAHKVVRQLTHEFHQQGGTK